MGVRSSGREYPFHVVQVLKDKDRLRKRTQLKRSVYRVLGEVTDDEGKETAAQDGDQSQGAQERDAHLKDYNENIFDDDDFYHQVRDTSGGVSRVTYSISHVTSITREGYIWW